MGIGLVIAVGGLAGLFLTVGGYLISRRASDAFLERRLGITEEKEREKRRGGRDENRASPLGDALNRALTSRGIGADLATQLARANVKLTVGEFLAATVILMVGGGGIAYFLSGDMIIVAGVCLAGFFLPRMYIGMVRKRRLKAFNDQLGDTINLMVNGIRAGYSVMQAMEAVADEMGPPVSEEFGRVVKEVQLGLTLEQAMDNMLRRITSDDLDMMVTAINVQREVGGNLAEVLDSISHTIRERVRIKGEIRTMTSYGRGAGNLLTAVPIILAVLIYLITPDFMSLLFTNRCGWIMIGAAVMGIILGYIIIGKIVDIDV